MYGLAMTDSALQTERSYLLTSPASDVTPLAYDVNQGPAIIVLETSKEGLLRVKVEPDIMAYILYCHYDEFARIQQAYSVAISWSKLDNTIIFCATTQADAVQLQLAATRFLAFYHHVSSTLVVAYLSSHTGNITLQQYHKATFEVKRRHKRAMIKDIKENSKIALYSPAELVAAATRTFLSALNATPSPELTSPGSNKTYGYLTNGRTLMNDGALLERRRRAQSGFISASDVDFYPSFNYHKAASPFAQPYYKGYSDGIIQHEPGYYDKTMTIPYEIENMEIHKRNSEDAVSSNASSGYVSNNGTIPRRYVAHDVAKHRTHSDGYFTTRLPPISQNLTRGYHHHHPHQRHVIHRRHPRHQDIIQSDPLYDNYVYDDIKENNRLRSASTLHRHQKRDYTRSNADEGVNCDVAMTQYQQTKSLHREYSKQKLQPCKVDTRVKIHRTIPGKKSFIPKLKSPFKFKQNHKKHFEITTPTGIDIEIFEGDITDTDCDVIVNETNSNLHVTGELAWAVAKHGSFELPKLTKLHVAMHGPVPESKVMVTPSVGLACRSIIHVVTPKWRNNDSKRSRKMLYNTYKNIFNVATMELKASSIALPVIGLETMSKSDESFPFHVATEILYQALIAFLKLGSSTLRHIRYIDNDPDHVNLVTTAIKPKMENVTFDPRFLRQQQSLAHPTYSSGSSLASSDLTSSNFTNGESSATMKTIAKSSEELKTKNREVNKRRGWVR
ncbi:uncharacterized protein LOC143466070 isoform X1 [Clavelina lepadiformis]|uniref:uncharacterized protein LOC143466070 isoform X1 n=1 Tax=Clavelina lepadiformis TaxID=159417 RepID=UPI004040FE5B